MDNDRDEFIPTRHTLLSRLRDWTDEESWKEFFDMYWKLIYRTALKAGLTVEEAQEVVQETVISVAKVMPDFEYNPAIGSFKNWLLHLTRWRITDQMRKRQPDNAAAKERVGTTTLESVPDPAGPALSAVWNEEWERNLWEAALERVRRRADPKQYQLFDLYVLQKWPVRKVASTMRVNSGRVYLAKHRVAGLLKKEVARLRGQMT